MLKALIYSSILGIQMLGENPATPIACDQLKVETSTTESSGGKANGSASVSVSGVAGTVQYFFCDVGGKVLNEEQINSNKIENLKKGTYYCIVSADKCSKKVQIIID